MADHRVAITRALACLLVSVGLLNLAAHGCIVGAFGWWLAAYNFYQFSTLVHRRMRDD